MRCFISIFLAVFLCASGPALAQTDDVAEICASLDRPNIDCTCVADRIDKFSAAGGFEAGGQFLVESYKNLVGAKHNLQAAQEARMADINGYMNFTGAMDDLGGEPDSIDEFENGCVIAGAERPSLPAIEAGSFIERALGACQASGGSERFCQCSEPRIRASMSTNEYEAMTRDIADWVGYDVKTSGNSGRSHAAIMGLTEDQYDNLVAAAAVKRADKIDQVTNYCEAMIWADDEAGVGADARKLAGFAPGEAEAIIEKANAGPSVMKTETNDLRRARTIIADGCSAQGNSDTYCGCIASEFRTKIVPAAGTPKVASGWAFMLYGADALPDADFMNGMQSLSTSGEMESVAMFVGQAPDIESVCYEREKAAAVPASGLTGSAYERQVEMCTSDGTDEVMCECMANQMQESLGPDDFELIVDIREAEYLGHEDGFEKVAADRGLTKEEAEQAMAMNNQMISGVMSMDPMACIGDIDLPPGFTLPQ
ncbi:MAG: hypothetical protein CMK09_09100 [Ponticaulis sp.]|nr:hypothetical protein [Ponticaulis sp.]|tara:strand:+ start:46295 stop:47746 length:1452 start_codon:yes stop_codon:yes gene_type:complete